MSNLLQESFAGKILIKKNHFWSEIRYTVKIHTKSIVGLT